MAGELITADNQIQWNGMLLGSGTGWRLQKLEGWRDLPAVRDADQDLPSEHGQRPGQSLLGARTVTATLVSKANPGTLPGLVDQVCAATALADNPTEAELVIRRAGVTRQVLARCTGRLIPQDLLAAAGYCVITLRWKATNPRLLRLPQETPSIGLAQASGGLAFPLAFPLAFGSGSSAGELVVTNAGDAPAQPVIEFLGPLTGPWVRDADSGRQLTTLPDYELPGRQKLTLDQQYRTVLLGSGDTAVSRSNQLGGRQWFSLPPGPTRLLWGHTGAFSPDARMAVRYYHTDL